MSRIDALSFGIGWDDKLLYHLAVSNEDDVTRLYRLLLHID